MGGITLPYSGRLDYPTHPAAPRRFVPFWAPLALLDLLVVRYTEVLNRPYRQEAPGLTARLAGSSSRQERPQSPRPVPRQASLLLLQEYLSRLIVLADFVHFFESHFCF